MKRTDFAGFLAAMALLGGATGSAQASTLTWEGITYSLTDESISSTPGASEDQFTLTISGINLATDLEGGRFGVAAFAFNQPTGFVGATAPGGFSTVVGGLNSNGCDMSGNFYCFTNNSTPSSKLPAGTTLTYIFDVTAASATDFTSYDPAFKIEWLGTKNNYSLVSMDLAPSVVPLPAGLPLLLSALAALSLLSLARRSELPTASSL